jgi:chromosome segregation ATPase
MPTDPAATARARVEKARAALDAALADGADTTKARATFELAQQELARVQVKTLADAQPVMAERRARIDADARALLDDALAALTGAVPIGHPANPPLPELRELPANIAQALAAARWELTDIQAKATEHGERLSALRERLSAIETERAQIITRRAEGHQEPDDGARLALLDADREGLAGLIQRTETQAPDLTRAEHQFADWSRQWEQAVTAARVALLGARADRHAAALAGTLRELRRASGAPSAPWNGWAELDRIRHGLVT